MINLEELAAPVPTLPTKTGRMKCSSLRPGAWLRSEHGTPILVAINSAKLQRAVLDFCDGEGGESVTYAHLERMNYAYVGLAAASNMRTMKTGAQQIADERERQIAVEKYDADHDDGHSTEIMCAAQSYLVAALHQSMHRRPDFELVRSMYWPWDKKHWKPDHRIRNLVKAGALIAAEIDRANRFNEENK